MSRITWTLALVAVVAVAMAGCGDGNGSDSGESSSGSAYSGKGGGAYGGEQKASSDSAGDAAAGGAMNAAVVSLGDVSDLGMVLVDSNGMTLYDFHKDKGGESSCYGACAEAWPPLLTNGEPRAEDGASAGKLGTTERKDGTTQVTYAGHPLYTFTGDKGPGEANGNDVDAFGAEWYALQGNGQEPED